LQVAEDSSGAAASTGGWSGWCEEEKLRRRQASDRRSDHVGRKGQARRSDSLGEETTQRPWQADSFDGGEMVENGMLLPRPGKRRKGVQRCADAPAARRRGAVGVDRTRARRAAMSAWARVARWRVGWLQAGCFGPAQNE
jgi:hypothetical protein